MNVKFENFLNETRKMIMLPVTTNSIFSEIFVKNLSDQEDVLDYIQLVEIIFRSFYLLASKFSAI